MTEQPDSSTDDIFDVIVVGAGPAGTQAAVSAAHQLRHVALIDAGMASRRRGRAFWSKNVEFVDVPVFQRMTGPHFEKALREWATTKPERRADIAGNRVVTGIRGIGAVAVGLSREQDRFALQLSGPPPHKDPSEAERSTIRGRVIVVASGYEDVWPDIEVDETAERMYEQYAHVFRYAGTRRGWHVCIRCDGHLHIDEHLAIVGAGDYVLDVARGAQDFTERITVLTNGRPQAISEEIRSELDRHGIGLEEDRIVGHVGRGSDLLGFRMANGRELFFDGFFVDEGLTANDDYLADFDVQHDDQGLLVCDRRHAILDAGGVPIPGLWACGDIVSGERKLIATAFGSGQDAGLHASDSLRTWAEPA